jgi:hypothetical protein
MSPPGIHTYLAIQEPASEDVVEIPLLLPGWQADALEGAAHEHGLTIAGMVRRLLNQYLAGRRESVPSRG